jgi:thioredoxin-related protein
LEAARRICAPGFLFQGNAAVVPCTVAGLAEIRSVKIHRSLLLLAVVLSVAFAGTLRAEPSWETDFKKAQEQAKTGKKLLLVDFTGSDWCGWCIKLNKEVFSQPEFAAYAEKNLVPVEVDFPRSKPQSAEVKKANQALQEKYKIEGYPTIIVLNSQGKQVGELGYTEGGPKAFIAKLEKLKNKS